MIRKTVHVLAASALIAASLPALADHNPWNDDYREGGYRQGRVVEYRYPVREVVVERPVYVERRVVVERPVYVDRRVVVERPVYVDQPVYVENPQPMYEPPAYGGQVYGQPVYEPAPAQGPFPPGTARKVMGTTAGAVVGAAIGSTIAHGGGRAAAAAVGAVVGGMLGGQF